MKGCVRAAFGAMSFVGIIGTAHAQACADFGDVFTSDTLVCPAAEWVKNRVVTLGCGDGTLYCPFDNVTRAQMAIFMQRLGKALSPTVLKSQHGSGDQPIVLPPNDEAAYFMCWSGVLAAAPYPRQVTLVGSVSGLAGAEAVTFRAFAVAKVGDTWGNFDGLNSVGHRATAIAGGWANAAFTEHMLLPANTPFEFSLGVRRDNVAPSASFTLTSLRCQMTASVSNANGSASPF